MKFNDLAEKRILGTSEVIHLLRSGKVIFIVDDAGYKKFIPQNETLEFWKEEVKIRIVEPDKADNGFELDEYLNGYCYIAREHRNIKNTEDATAYIILQMFH